MKGSEIRRRQGFYSPPVRTKRTVAELGPRDPGPHGKTLEQRAAALAPWMPLVTMGGRR